MKMRLKSGQKLFQLFSVMMFCMTLFLLGDYVLAASTETWYTDFKITSPTSVSVQDGQTTGTFEWSLTNHDTGLVVGQFYFVDAVPLGSGYYACKADNQSGVFGKYLHMDGSTNFSISSGETITGIVDFNFPSSYSGYYHGCIVYSVGENLNNGDYMVNMTSRKAIPVHVQLQASEVGVRIVANLGSRWNAYKLHFKGYQSKGKLLFYQPGNHTTPIYSGYVVMDSDGNGVLSGVSILSDTYDVVYKSWQHLASYMLNVTINEGDVLNFVLGDVIGVGEKEHSIEPWNSGWTYQIAGDLPDSSGTYNYLINGTDLSVLQWDEMCPYGQHVSEGHFCDLNNDSWVDSTDVSVIVANTNMKDAAYYDGLFSGFGNINYFDFDSLLYDN